MSVVLNQKQSNYSNQSQQEQHLKRTNQKLKQIQVINVKRGKTHASKSWFGFGFTPDWLRLRWRELFEPMRERCKAKSKGYK